jgi:hypothetical protein
MYGIGTFLAILATASIAQAHTVITYPGWRGNNLHTNGTLPEQNPGSLGIDFSDNGTSSFPWGQQWIYPCKRNLSTIRYEANRRLTLHSQAVACLNQPTAPSGPSMAVAFPSSQAGSLATASLCSTSTLASLSLETLHLATCHTQSFHLSSL